MSDVHAHGKRKSTRNLILAALAILVIALIAWWTSRDSNDGAATGMTEDGVVTFENTPPDSIGVGTPSRDLPGANNDAPGASLGTSVGDEASGEGTTTGPQSGTNPAPREGAQQ
jgi:hypothetical protein